MWGILNMEGQFTVTYLKMNVPSLFSSAFISLSKNTGVSWMFLLQLQVIRVIFDYIVVTLDLVKKLPCVGKTWQLDRTNSSSTKRSKVFVLHIFASTTCQAVVFLCLKKPLSWWWLIPLTATVCITSILPRWFSVSLVTALRSSVPVCKGTTEWACFEMFSCREERVRGPGQPCQPVGGGSNRGRALSWGDPDGVAPQTLLFTVYVVQAHVTLYKSWG